METVQEFLNHQLNERRKKNPQFSMRAMAKLVGISSGQLSKLLQGKKKLTAGVALKLAEKLHLNGEQSKTLMQFVHPNLFFKTKEAPSQEIVLKEKDVLALSDWYYFGILSLCRLKSNEASASWVSRQLGIDVTTAQKALDRLLTLGLVWIENGKMVRSEATLTTSADVPSMALRQSHKKNLQLAIQKIDTVPIEDREYTHITCPVDPKKIQKAKKMIVEFREALAYELKGPNLSEVFTLSVQLFPLTNNKGASV